MKNITIAGRLGGDAEVKHTNSGDSVTQFTVAVDSREKKDGEYKKTTEWFSVSLWGKRGESLARFLEKGTHVCVSGDLSVRSYQAKDGTLRAGLSVKASEITLQGGGKQREDGNSSAPSNIDDDIPF